VWIGLGYLLVGLCDPVAVDHVGVIEEQGVVARLLFTRPNEKTEVADCGQNDSHVLLGDVLVIPRLDLVQSVIVYANNALGSEEAAVTRLVGLRPEPLTVVYFVENSEPLAHLIHIQNVIAIAPVGVGCSSDR